MRFIGTSQSDIKSEKSEERRVQRGHAFGVYIVAEYFFALLVGSLQRDRKRPLVSLVGEGRHR